MLLLLWTTLTLRSSKLARPNAKVHRRDSTTCQMASATGPMVNKESLRPSSIICLIKSQKTHLWQMLRTSTQWCSSNHQVNSKKAQPSLSSLPCTSQSSRTKSDKKYSVFNYPTFTPSNHKYSLASWKENWEKGEKKVVFLLDLIAREILLQQWTKRWSTRRQVVGLICKGRVCTPYGLSVRVNAETTLPDELKYKDWGASGSERINSTWPLECLMAGLPGSHL